MQKGKAGIVVSLWAIGAAFSAQKLIVMDARSECPAHRGMVAFTPAKLRGL
jgi:hypothetical protein